MKYLYLIAIKFLGDRLYTQPPVDGQKVHDWLKDNYKDGGWMGYYTTRKKYLMSLLENGVEGREYLETVGRLKELKALSSNILTAQRKELAKKNETH